MQKNIIGFKKVKVKIKKKKRKKWKKKEKKKKKGKFHRTAKAQHRCKGL